MPSTGPFSVKISGLSDRHKVIFFGLSDADVPEYAAQDIKKRSTRL